MGIQKEGIKSEGGYVGGFFQLFDWTSKSRKKLFASKPDLPESLKQRRKIDGNLNMMQPYLADEDEIGIAASIRGSSDHSYASSVTDDEVFGKRVPGVVARLMGLDSLPSSSFPDPYSSPYLDSKSLQDMQCWRTNLNHQVPYSGKLLEKVEGSSRNLMELKPQKIIISRPIEKFQKEVMPPKSAKSIPVTHHKLLSPIKSPGFVPMNNPAYIMEAASRIIEPGRQATAKAKTPLVSSSSSTMSLRIRDLKEKVEASQKVPLVGSSSKTSRVRDQRENREISHRTSRVSEPSQRSVESNSSKSLRGQSLNKSWNGSLDTPMRSATEPKEDSTGKNIGKSISLAIQAKVNVQRREGLNLSAGRSSVEPKEHSDKPNQPLKVNVQNSLHKKSSGQNASGVLKQNNLKQNHSVEKDKQPSKQVVSNSHGRKVLTGDSGRHRSSSSKSTAKSKVGSKKPSMQVTDSEKEVLYTSTNNFPRKKRSTDRDWNDRVVDKLFTEKPQRPLQSNLVSNQHHSWDDEVKKKDMDVVSFTFTTPLARNSSGFETSGQVGLKTDGLYLDHHMKRVLLETESSHTTRSPLGYNVIGGDALGILLDQKLRELTSGVETSCGDSIKGRPSSSTATKTEDMLPASNSDNHIPQLQQKKDQDRRSLGSDVSFTGLPHLSSKHRLWADKMEECKSNLMETQPFNCRSPSPISVLEPSFSTESFESSFSTDAATTQGSKLCSSSHSQGLNFSSRKSYLTEADTDLSDSACSTSITTMVKNHTRASSTWELDYVSDILCNVELMYMDFAIGRARDIVNPHLFNQLESRRKGGYESDDGESRIRRVIFDCVSECLDLKCRRYVGGGYKMWTKGIAMVRRNEWLAREVYKEISSWKRLGDSMVDELVDKDMSSQYGRWLDFEVDTFELGAEVEDQIFNSLMDDVVADILQS